MFWGWAHWMKQFMVQSNKSVWRCTKQSLQVLCKRHLFQFIFFLNVKIKTFLSEFWGEHIWTVREPLHNMKSWIHEHVGHPLSKYFKKAPHVWEKKKWCIFCRHSMVQNQLLGNLIVQTCTWSHYSIITYKLQYSWRVWTLPVHGRKFYFIQWACVIEWSPHEKSHWIPTGK